ncbi:hypothetical protein AB0O91_06315 [Kitasatospora sp. NPDC089797]|uniref:hypothetical protein n=1 Tax=Kitasatospora sp. NPDC089797 TaxID=3155298 RepID=UPI0034228D1A
MKRWTDDLPQIPFPYRGLPPDGPWMTMEEAAARLGVGHYRMNLLTAGTYRIDIVRTTGKEFAVTRASVEAERNWRTTATVPQKLWRLFKDALTFL